MSVAPVKECPEPDVGAARVKSSCSVMISSFAPAYVNAHRVFQLTVLSAVRKHDRGRIAVHIESLDSFNRVAYVDGIRIFAC